MAESGGSLFLDALRGRVGDTLDACTRCGKCVAACPMVEPAGIDLGEDAAKAPAIVGSVLDLLAGGEGTAEAERWAQVCTNSGKCIPACDYGVNPRFMVNMARIAVKAKRGDAFPAPGTGVEARLDPSAQGIEKGDAGGLLHSGGLRVDNPGIT